MFGRAGAWIGVLDSSSQLAELLLYSTVKVNHAKRNPYNKFWRVLPTQESSRPFFIFPNAITLVSLVGQHTYGLTRCSAQVMVSFKEELDLNCLVNTFGFFFFWLRCPQEAHSGAQKRGMSSAERWMGSVAEQKFRRLCVDSPCAAARQPLLSLQRCKEPVAAAGSAS